MFLLQWDKASIKNLVFTSSVAIYGLNKSNPDEITDPDPFNHYGKSKLQAEKKCWYDADPVGKSVIRPTVIFVKIIEEMFLIYLIRLHPLSF